MPGKENSSESENPACRINKVTRADGAKVFELENSFLKIGVVPEEGGRVAYITSKSTGHNHLSVMMDGIEDIVNDNGMTEVYPGEFMNLCYAVSFLKEKGKIGIVVSAQKGYIELKRSICIYDNLPKVTLDVSYKNITVNTHSFKIRIHPKFNIGEGKAITDSLFMPVENRIINVVYDGTRLKPVEKWILIFDNDTREALIALCNPGQIDYILPWGMKKNNIFYTLEYYGKTKNVKPDDKVEMTLEYWFITNCNELDILRNKENKLGRNQREKLLNLLEKKCFPAKISQEQRPGGNKNTN
ncbi:MAG: hypothetical protein PHV82_04600 [Victivallaceae bacterium]|nr:hypothetical protein [Victivallaceae bacterium]